MATPAVKLIAEVEPKAIADPELLLTVGFVPPELGGGAGALVWMKKTDRLRRLGASGYLSREL